MREHCMLLIRIASEHGWRSSSFWYFKVAPIAHIVYLEAPHFVRSLRSIWGPLIPAIKAVRPNVAFEYPENRFSKSQIEKPRTRCRYECNAKASAPVVGINVQRTEFSVIWHIQVLRGHCRSKTPNHPAFGQDDGMRLGGIEAPKIVFLRAILGTKLIEIFIRHQFAVCDLPGANMDLRYRHGISWFGVSELHIADGTASTALRRDAVGS